MKKNGNSHLQYPAMCRFTKIPRIMKLITLFLLVTFLHSYGAGYSQPNVTLNLKNVALSEVFSEIQKKTKITILFNDDLLPTNKTFNINVESQPVQKVFDILFAGTDLSYKFFEDNYVVIGSKKYIASQAVITGRVVAADGTALVGVSVKIKGGGNGTSTDSDGRYSITGPEDAVIVFSSVGFVTIERNLNSNTVINVTLQIKNNDLNEVVVVGYGTQKKREISSAIATIRASDIKDLRVTSLDQALQGKVAGVQVTNNTGAPGSFVQIRIRGTTSLTGGNEPLYIVDGVPINNTLTGGFQAGNDQINGMAGINPNDIESLEILKDASATSIYGARAANGVVLITTKRGKPGKSGVGITFTNGVAQQNRRYDLLDANQYAIISNELRARQNPTANPIYLKNPDVNTNWQDQIFTTGRFTDANINFSGGSEKIQYSIAGGMFDQKGTIINSRFRRYSFRSNIDLKVNDKIKIGTNLYFARTLNNRLRNDGGPNFQDQFNGNSTFGPNILSSALVFNPTLPVFNADGTYSRDTINGNSNPVALATEAKLISRNLRLIGNFFAEWDIIKALKFRTTVGTDLRSENEDFFFPPNPAALGSGRASSRNFNEVLLLVENTLNYKKKFGAAHSLDALAGFTVQDSKQRSSLATASGLTNSVVQIVGGPLTSGSSDIQANGILSYYARTNYNYNSKYYLSLAGRLDASSRFGTNRKQAFFPSVSLGWIVSDENFLKNSKVLDFLKLRTSYGITGNQEIQNYGYLSTISLNATYLGQLGANVNNIEDENYRWEQTKQFNIGVDFSLFKGRVNIVTDYYQKTTEGLILDNPLPSTTGFGSRQGNIGSLENKGIEFTLNTNNLIGKLKWNTSFNISSNKVKILSLVDGQDIKQGSFGNSNIAREGKELSFFLFEVEDLVDPLTGKMKRVDQNKDGNINEDDMVIAGSPLPKFIGGITNNFQYKQFDLSVFFQWSSGNKIYNQTREFVEGYGDGYYNSTTEALKRWQKPGDVTSVPFIGANNGATGYASKRFLEDGSYLRLKNVTFGYNFSAKLLKDAGMKSVRVYLSAQNLLTFTNYTGFDPEVNHFTGNSQFNNIVLGFDNASYPQAKTITAGLSINF